MKRSRGNLLPLRITIKQTNLHTYKGCCHNAAPAAIIWQV